MTRPLPGELTTTEAFQLLESIEAFGRPRPLLVLTGGDVLSRDDLPKLLVHAHDLRLRVTLAPTVSPALTKEALREFVDLGVSGISISLDGDGPVHDGIRGVPGHWERTCEAIRTATANGLRVQVNTCVMRDNLLELARIFARVQALDAGAWEVFFLIKVGRGGQVQDLTPDEYEACVHFLYDASCRGIIVRTVEAPFFRRVVLQRKDGRPPPSMPTYREFISALPLVEELPAPSLSSTTGTRDGNGIVFIAYDGTIQPGGFLPIPCGNVRTASLRDTYVDHPLFAALRSPDRFRGRCGTCEYREVCGGSRARAFSYFGDPFQEDPACPYVPPSPRRDHGSPPGQETEILGDPSPHGGIEGWTA